MGNYRRVLLSVVLLFTLSSTVYSQNVGIGTTSPASKLDVSGGLTVGATYAGTNTAPANGALIEGNVGIGTTLPSVALDVNGQIRMRLGATNGFIPVGDANGVMTWTDPSTIISGNTLDGAYDEGGVGAGRSIIADAGAVSIQGTDGLEVIGTFGSGDTVATATGTRMFFNPNKAAFRAGATSNTAWNNVNVGAYSFAAGNNTLAYGQSSSALGFGTLASGSYSTAIGYITYATNTSAIGIGANSNATGPASVVMGSNSTSSGDGAVAIGSYNIASGHSATALGGSTTASGNYSFASGFNNTASGTYSFAGGSGNTASGTRSFAFGQSNSIDSDRAAAIGRSNSVFGDEAQVFGVGLIANPYNQIVIGRYNDDVVANSSTSWDGNDRLFTIGNGSTGSTRSNAMVVMQNGNVGIGISSPDATMDILGTLQYDHATAAAGYVLHSVDAAGNADWADPTSLLSGDFWSTTGNTGTSPTTNFVGTTDAQDLVFRTNNTENMRINTSGNIDIGAALDNARIYTRILDTDLTTSYGIYNYHDGATSGVTYGLRNLNYSATNSTKYGIYNYVNNEGTGGRYGINNYVYLNSATSSSAYGINNYVSTQGSGTQFGLYNQVISTTSTGVHYGQRNNVYLAVGNTSDAYGEYTFVDYSSGDRYGEYKALNSHATYDGTLYGDYNRLYGTGDGANYGLYNAMEATGTGIKYGLRNEYANVQGIKYGVYNYFPAGTASGSIYGTYNNVLNDGSGAQYGVRNYLSGGTGSMRGSYSSIYPASGNTNSIYGVYCYVSSAGTGSHYGGYFSATGSGNYGVYGYNSGGYAGYFNGVVYTTASYQSSDQKLKKNISQYTGAISALLKLQPVTYEYDLERYPQMSLPAEMQIGLTAQNVEGIFPELVKTTYQRPERVSVAEAEQRGLSFIKDKEEPTMAIVGESVEFKAVNYTGLVPVLVKAIQEQQVLIDSLQQQLTELEVSINRK